MFFNFPLRKLLSVLCLPLVLGLSLLAAQTADQALTPKTDRAQRSSTVSKIEVRQLVDLLERYHYNRDKIRPASYAKVIPDFMEDLDGQKLFFLGSDRLKIEKSNASSLFYNLRDLGNIQVAFDIFEIYENRVNSRIAWVLDELSKDTDFTTKEFYRADRSKSDWPDSIEAADELWRLRLKYELLGEMLDKKSLEEAKEKVRKRYVRMQKNTDEFDNNDISEIFLSAFSHLFDPHSTYFSASSFEDFGIQMKLKLVGIGAVLGVDDDVCVIKEIIPGGPADLDKRLKPNDKILAVAQQGEDPVDIVGMKLRKIVDQIRGKKDTKVSLTVQPADDTDGSTRKEVVITRDVVKLNNARAHAAVFTVPSAEDPTATTSIGVITLPSFYGGDDPSDPSEEKTSCSKDVEQLITLIKKENVQAMVLDMRRNGGGLLSEAVSLTGLFIEKGPIVQVKDSSGYIDPNSDDDPKIAYDGPLAVLVDRFSASASEIVAGALQDYGRAIVIGDSSTHGKGTVQQIVEMSRVIPGLLRPSAKTGATKFTIQKFYLPSGASTQVRGVVPDIVLPSWENYIPNIGEADLKNALVWDEIPTSFFEGKHLSMNISKLLLEQSRKRQETLEEFAFLNRNIDWFKTRQEQKMVSLNLDDRLKQKENDEAYRKETKAERKRLEANAYVYKELRLVPAPPPSIKAKAKDDTSPEDEDEDAAEGYAKLDIQLRETLRILSDALALGHDPTKWGQPYPPLTAQATKANALAN